MTEKRGDVGEGGADETFRTPLERIATTGITCVRCGKYQEVPVAWRKKVCLSCEQELVAEFESKLHSQQKDT